MRQKQSLQPMHIMHIPQSVKYHTLQGFCIWTWSLAGHFGLLLFQFKKKDPCLLCWWDFLKFHQSRCTTKMETIFYVFNSLFTLNSYLLDSSFVTSVSAKFTVALGASPTCAKSTSAPYQFTAFTTCIHVTEEHLDTITIIEGVGFVLGAGLDSDFTTFLE